MKYQIKPIFKVIALSVLSMSIFACTPEADRGTTGDIVAEGNIDAFQIQVGDCFNDNNEISGQDDTVEVVGVAGIPCAQPHDNEAYAKFDVDFETYPGNDDMFNSALESCVEQFEGYVGRDYQSSLLDILTLYPTAESWKQMDDREVICVLVHMEDEKLVGSSRNSAL